VKIFGGVGRGGPGNSRLDVGGDPVYDSDRM